MKEAQAIYRALRNLAKRFGGGFTPEGVLVASLGEVLAIVLEGGKQTDSKGSVGLSHNKLRTLNKSVPAGKRVPLRK